ncbi:MAG: penicillin-binding protein [SAR324 cluster bacterium]|nr:penicillin-binding protein [SAR324 cluster bacterium]
MKRVVWIPLICLLSAPVLGLLAILVGFSIAYPHIIEDFDFSLAQLRTNTVIYDRDGEPYTIIDGIEDRQIVPRKQVSRYLQLSILAIEDARFLKHRGIDIFRIFGALWVNVKGGAYLQGGSTITQQLAKLMLLTPEKTIVRKIKEMFMAWALEFRYSKWEILEHYLNTIYLGYGNYGVQQAALVYFSRSANELTLAQSALIAGIINKPEIYLKLPKNFERPKYVYFPDNILTEALQRQRLVLSQLYKHRWIKREEYERAMQEKLFVRIPPGYPVRAPYFVQHIRTLLENKFQLPHISSGGYKIYTTLDSRLQSYAEAEISQAFRKKPQFDQAALVSIEPHTGYVRSLVGGKNYNISEFNRVTQAMRQPGSSFKAIVYASALEEHLAINSRFVDEPLSFEWQEADGSISVYEPRNFDRLYGAEREQVNADGEIYYEDFVTVSKAFEKSMNTIAVQILNEIGIRKVLKKARQLNIFLPDGIGLCLALGCSEVKLLNMVAAYTTFMNQGRYAAPVFILRIEDSSGKEIYQYQAEKPKTVFSEWTVHQMNQMLRGVILRGTGRAANWKENRHFIGGKTGTTTDFRDAWFIGFAPELATGVWVGNDDNTSMRNETGGGTPARIWSKYMQKSLAVLPDRPRPSSPAYKKFPTCTVSGGLATYSCPDVQYFHYPGNDLPSEPCPIHPGFIFPENKPVISAKFGQSLNDAFSDSFKEESPIAEDE